MRIPRNNVLTKSHYHKIMTQMFNEKNFKPRFVKKLLFLKKKNFHAFVKKGHVVGLHSHTNSHRIANID